ncbi:MAG: hypothetical protein OEZ21_08515 [Candidatus Bathyarchaeota archaeon]|nr:hypothetical protein [Candidatus Bathyarchaeota archaeon]MDH5746980.1 hypothetical protein [Candidatus Bathyarchaeota archaeon]
MNFPSEADCGDRVFLDTLDEALNKVNMDKLEVVRFPLDLILMHET